MNRHLLISLSLLAALFAAVPANALPPEKGFYVGGGLGKSALNNDLHIYDTMTNSRQPELNVRESNKSKDSTHSLYAGYNFAGMQTNILGKGMLQLGVQGGYTALGQYTLKANYFNVPLSSSGYRTIDENASDLLLTSTLYWENGFNIFVKAGVAQLHGKYTQQGLLTARQPEFTPAKETVNYTVYRPEFAIGTGVLLLNTFNLYLQSHLSG